MLKKSVISLKLSNVLTLPLHAILNHQDCPYKEVLVVPQTPGPKRHQLRGQHRGGQAVGVSSLWGNTHGVTARCWSSLGVNARHTIIEWDGNTWREKLTGNGWLFLQSVQQLENAIVTSLKRFKGFLCWVVYLLNYKISKNARFSARVKFIDMLHLVADSTLKVDSNSLIFRICQK